MHAHAQYAMLALARMWKKLKKLFRRDWNLSTFSPKVTPDPETAAKLSQKHTSYVPHNGFLTDQPQERIDDSNQGRRLDAPRQ